MKKKQSGKVREKKLIHGAVWFECQECGKRWRMWLEKGVEDKRFRRIYPENHKPMPDTIKCWCGGSAEHVDYAKDMVLSNYRNMLPNMNHFSHIDKEEYGVPILRREKEII